MVKFEVNGKKGHCFLNLPTSLTELSPEYFEKITNDIEVADNYSLIGLVYREKLSAVILASRQHKLTINAQVTPIFIKKGNITSTSQEANKFFNNVECRDKLIIAGTDIKLGHHVYVAHNHLTVGNFLDYIEGDANIAKNPMKVTDSCIFLEFKIVPNCAIKGVYKDNVKRLENPFITPIAEK